MEQDESETTALRPYARLERHSSNRSQAAMTRVIVTFLKSMVGSYILYTPKVQRVHTTDMYRLQ